MARLLTQAVRLLKFGAVAGAAVGIGRVVMNRRRKAEATESTWPTIAETAADNGESIDDAPESPNGDVSAAADEGASMDAGDDGDDTEES